MSLLDNFPHECTIRKKTFSKGSLGGRKSSYVNVSTGVECWEQPAGDSDVTSFQKRGMNITHKVYFLTDPGVTRRHQIQITKRNGSTISSPVALDVLSNPIPDTTAGLGVCYKVLCSQITSEDD